MERRLAIGIDLGTTSSCVAVFQHGKVEIIANDQGNPRTPSYIAFTDTGRLIGDPAKNQVAMNGMNPVNTIFDAKRLIGRKFQDSSVQGDMKHWPFEVVSAGENPKLSVEYRGETKTLFPEEISSMVLTKMKEVAEAYLGKSVTDVVITVPSRFNSLQRQATIDAGTIAGLKICRIINESTAAAIAYCFDKKVVKRNVLVFDLGGGNLDVSIVNIRQGMYEVVSTSGDLRLGGRDFTNRMVTFFAQEFKRKYKRDISANKAALCRLRTCCDRAKEVLSDLTEAPIHIDCLDGEMNFYTSVTRARFEELNADLFLAALESVKRAIRDAQMYKSQINDIVLVGGSTRIPKIQKLLQDFFEGKKLIKSFLNPNETAAYGAAVHAAVMLGDPSPRLRKILLIDATPHSLGIETAGGVMNTIIARNTAIPFKQSQSFTISLDDQKAALIQVYEGEYPLTKDNDLLKKIKITDIPVTSKGVCQIEVTFDIDVNSCLRVTTVEKTTGRQKQVTIRSVEGRSSNEEMKRMILQAEKFKVDNKKEKERVAARVCLEGYCAQMRNAFGGVENVNVTIPEKDWMAVLNKFDAVKAWLDFDVNRFTQKEQFEAMQKELKQMCIPIIFMLNDASRDPDPNNGVREEPVEDLGMMA